MINKQYLIAPAVLIFGIGMLMNCAPESKSKNDRYNDMDQRTKTRFRQYMTMGRALYLKHCANCHGQKGEGLEKLIPPLANSDYLITHIEKAACVITGGMKGEIIVNGITYNQEMPAHTNLSALEVAEIVTYISNSWGNGQGLISVKDMEEFLQNCAK